MLFIILTQLGPSVAVLTVRTVPGSNLVRGPRYFATFSQCLQKIAGT